MQHLRCLESSSIMFDVINKLLLKKERWNLSWFADAKLQLLHIYYNNKNKCNKEWAMPLENIWPPCIILNLVRAIKFVITLLSQIYTMHGISEVFDILVYKCKPYFITRFHLHSLLSYSLYFLYSWSELLMWCCLVC